MYNMYMTTVNAPRAHRSSMHLAVADARAHLKDVLDASDEAYTPTISRGGQEHAIVPAPWLRQVLSRSVPAEARVGQESTYWYVILPKWNLAVDAPRLDDALGDMVGELREYAEDWHDHLRHAPNHSGSQALVTLIDLSTDEQLREWLEA